MNLYETSTNVLTEKTFILRHPSAKTFIVPIKKNISQILEIYNFNVSIMSTLGDFDGLTLGELDDMRLGEMDYNL